MSRTTRAIMAWIITCSSDSERPVGQLYVHGGPDGTRWLPSTHKEAAMRLEQCRRKMGCQSCDAEITRITFERTEDTLLQLRRHEETHRQRCE